MDHRDTWWVISPRLTRWNKTSETKRRRPKINRQFFGTTKKMISRNFPFNFQFRYEIIFFILKSRRRISPCPSFFLGEVPATIFFFLHFSRWRQRRRRRRHRRRRQRRQRRRRGGFNLSCWKSKLLQMVLQAQGLKKLVLLFPEKFYFWLKKLLASLYSKAQGEIRQ